MALSQEEHERRLKIYMNCQYVSEMAEQSGLTKRGFYSWMESQGLKAPCPQENNRYDRTYLTERPVWERDLIRRYASALERCADTYKKTTGESPDWEKIWQFTDAWVEMYGTKQEEAL